MWECTEDLLKHIKSESKVAEEGARSFRRVLDLGCGTGLLGIAAAKTFPATCKYVAFQDYNAKVIEAVTMPNFRANFSDTSVVDAMFVSGPWATLNSRLTFLQIHSKSGFVGLF